MDTAAPLVSCAYGPCTGTGTMACMGCKGLGPSNPMQAMVPSNTYYCSKEHQTLDWKTREGGTHKAVCRARCAAAAAAAAAAGGNAALGKDQEGPAIAADPLAPEATAAAETDQVQALPCLSALVRAVRCRAMQPEHANLTRRGDCRMTLSG